MHGGGVSPSYEVISQKIFNLTNDGFPKKCFCEKGNLRNASESFVRIFRRPSVSATKEKQVFHSLDLDSEKCNNCSETIDENNNLFTTFNIWMLMYKFPDNPKKNSKFTGKSQL